MIDQNARVFMQPLDEFYLEQHDEWRISSPLWNINYNEEGVTIHVKMRSGETSTLVFDASLASEIEKAKESYADWVFHVDDITNELHVTIECPDDVAMWN